MAISSISIIGSGNLATHLAKNFFKNNIKISQIFSRRYDHASSLARQVNATAVSKIEELSPVDLIIISVSDSAISQISHSLKLSSLIVHTSGSTAMEVLTNHDNFGVFYPFQSFSKDVDLEFDDIPVFVEANTSENLLLLKHLAGRITGKVSELHSEQRLKLHISAVFANNFTNHMYSIAREILKDANLPFEVLSHLIKETTRKALETGDPANVQTGPAIRNNTAVIDQHKEMLAHNPLWQKIYIFVSNSIIERETHRRHGTF